MDFGRTFVALDPDGHRLRVFAPAPDALPAEEELVTIPAFPGA